MKVTKTAWVEVGSGTPKEFTEAMRVTHVPDIAHPIALDSSYDMIEYVDETSTYIFRVRVKFEWVGEE